MKKSVCAEKHEKPAAGATNIDSAVACCGETASDAFTARAHAKQDCKCMAKGGRQKSGEKMLAKNKEVNQHGRRTCLPD